MIPINEIIQDIEIIEDVQNRYHYLIELGKKLPSFPKEHMIEQNIVRGCANTIWMTIDLKNKEDKDPSIFLNTTSDSHIVSGLLYILKSIYDGKKVSETITIDYLEIFQRLGLIEHLSQKRTAGLHVIVQKIQDLTKEYSNNNYQMV
ncbi:SufE family protein [Candidatus Liberibacter solanacearum]|uniref:Fe-S metabolism associated domain-containing protein n=1 Tax=Candidatus Liberibacter solanacearum TaxID=556287 RepID=A0A1V2N997_9HYPH|nr:SufE family protein [Candidatus Liberibacter solanacearum]ONI58670.1 hypothetical protein AYJ09_04630 [Candidatus Liberibacter solanacearum]ONI60278.1 hypothetical protein AYO25_00200 [Candidatus Liberibacter solanacearum]